MTMIARIVRRMLGALLLALMIVSPAAAEVGCVEDAIVHAQDVLSNDVQVDEPQDESERDAPDQVSHCAFSHGHCAAVVVSGMADLGVDPVESVQASPDTIQAAGGAREGPERPPRA
jgi:hypothetical protein